MADYSGTPPSLTSIEQDQKQFKDLISYHPVSDPATMWTLHTHYTRLGLRAALEEAHSKESRESSACNALVGLGGVAVSDCSKPFCECPAESSRCPGVGVVNDPPKSYHPATIYDYQSWVYFDDRTLYNDKLILPSASLQQQKDTRKELQVRRSDWGKSNLHLLVHL